MNRLLKKGLAIIGLLMVVVFSFTGCDLVDAATFEFRFMGDSFALNGWQAILAGGLLLAAIAIIVAIIFFVRKKKK